MKKRVFALTLCLFVVMTVLCGCVNEETSAELEQQSCAVLDALRTGNAESGWQAFSEKYCTREEYDAFFEAAAPYFQDLGAYELKQTGWYTSIDDGIKMTELTYAVIEDEMIFCVITAVQVDGVEGLAGINFRWPEEPTPASSLDLAKTLLIAVFAVFAVIFVAVVIIIVVVVRRHKAKKRREEEARIAEAVRRAEEALLAEQARLAEEAADAPEQESDGQPTEEQK